MLVSSFLTCKCVLCLSIKDHTVKMNCPFFIAFFFQMFVHTIYIVWHPTRLFIFKQWLFYSENELLPILGKSCVTSVIHCIRLWLHVFLEAQVNKNKLELTLVARVSIEWRWLSLNESRKMFFIMICTCILYYHLGIQWVIAILIGQTMCISQRCGNSKIRYDLKLF